MQLIKHEKFHKKLLKSFEYEFEIEEDGLYVIEIIASCKSWRQNLIKFVSFFKDDDLTVKIDGISFPKLNGRRGLFDGEVAWNGNNLNGLKKTVIFLINLKRRSHTIQFLINQNPYLEDIKIYHLQDKIFEIKNKKAETGNRRQWLTLVLSNLSLNLISIIATTDKHPKKDDDDLKLIIDNNIQKNTEPKSHKYWYWCGRTLKGKQKEFNKEVNLPQGLHYVELWADNTPIVGQISFKLTEQEPANGEVGRIALYADIDPEIKTANLRAQSNDKSEVLKKIPNGTRIVIIKKAIIGSRPIGYLSDLWHEVLYQGTKGFVNSSLIEIHGQEREKIIKAIKIKAKELDIDENLALNLAHCESKWLSFAHSETNNKGIYQLGESTIEDINKKYGGNVTDPYDSYQNIDGGLRYLKFLLRRYSGLSDYLIRVIVAWNVGYTKIPVDGTFYLGNYKDPQTKKLLNCIMKERRGENVLKYLKLLILPLIIGIGLWVFFTSDDYKNLNAEERYLTLVAQQEIDHLTEGENFALVSPSEAREKEVEAGYLQTDIDGDKVFEKIIFSFYSPEPFAYYTNIYTPDGEKIIISGSLREVFADDLTSDGVKELIVTTIPGHLSATYIFSYENGRLIRIPIYDEEGAEFQRTMYDENGIEFQIPRLMTTKGIRFEDLDGDKIKEIILSIRNYSNEFIELAYYYRWNGKGFILYNKTT